MIIQVVGSLLILAGFALSQQGILSMKSKLYLLLNFFGSTILAVNAFVEGQWGFLLLEGTWSLVSAWGLLAVLTRSRIQSKAKWILLQ
ncbi:MAG: hypothetical protein Q8M73_03590 [Actinomycetota bacterium]|nr:hypothetical protein [Actinomycetota bacterium]